MTGKSSWVGWCFTRTEGGVFNGIEEVGSSILPSSTIIPVLCLIGRLIIAHPTVARLASAFLPSEFADFAVYSPLRAKGKIKALFAANAFGLVTDSILFLYLAFGSLEFLSGQVVAKAYITAGVILIMVAYRLFFEWTKT